MPPPPSGGACRRSEPMIEVLNLALPFFGLMIIGFA
jgi:hypothetical protein